MTNLRIAIPGILLVFLSLKLFAQPASFLPKGFGGGGYTYVPSINPHNNTDIFINCDMGGLYRSLDAGQTWKLQPSQQLISMVKGKVQFTSDPNMMYVCHRSTTNLDDPLWRGEIAKSTDNGNSWQKITDPTSSGVHRLEVDPSSTQRMLLNEYNRLYFTKDAGLNWSIAYSPNDDKMWLGGVVWDGQNIYVGTDKGLLVSKNGGTSFSIEPHAGLPSGNGIYHLSGAKAGGITRLFCIPAHSDDLYAWYNPLELKGNLKGAFRMNYATNATWTNTRGNIPTDFEIAWIDLAKNNTQVVWADGNDQNDTPSVYKSTDGGLTWTNTLLLDNNQNLSTGWAGYDGAYWLQHTGAALGFDVSDNDPNLVYRTHGQGESTSDGGINWRSTTILQSTQNLAGQPTLIQKSYQSSGLDVTSAHQLFFKNDHELFLANTDVGLTYSADTGKTWTFAHNTFYDYGPVANNNWYRIIERPDNKVLYAAASNINDIYLGYRITDDQISGGGIVVKSTDGGASFDTLFNFGHPVVWLELDKTNPDRMWASVVDPIDGGIYRTENAGLSWIKLPAPPRTEGHPYNIVSLANGGLVVTYSARALSDGVTLTESSGVFYSTDKGNSWQDRTDNAMQMYTKDLVVDPTDPTEKTWYATVWGRFTTFAGPNNAGNGGLYKTMDSGQNWSRIFANERAESITIHPTKPGTAYLTAENDALYFTQNLGDAQPDFNKVASFPFWRPKRVFFNPYKSGEVWVTTMGGGLWQGKSALETPILMGNPSVCADGTTLYATQPQPGAVYLWKVIGGQIVSGQGTNEITVKWGVGGNGSVTVEVTD